MTIELAGPMDVPCPHCGQQTLRIEHRLEAKPLGTHSLSGSQMKVSAMSWPYLVCDNCKVEARGRME